MQSTKNHVNVIKADLYSHQLEYIVADIPQHIKTMSFDCFDTIIWRKAAEPMDVFYHLDSSTKTNNCRLRQMAEKSAYALNTITKNTTQVTFDDIYKQAFPLLKKDEIDCLIENEIQCEVNDCYAFAPILQLMRSCHARGMSIIVVSDTYFNKAQLQRLLKAKLPTDLYEMIDEVYCSSDYATAKHEKLFPLILEKRRIQAGTVLHIGDNRVSDSEKPASYGIHTIRLLQYSPTIAEIIRMHSVVAPFLDPDLRSKRGLSIPFKNLYANLTDESAPTIVGYATIGPILLAFSDFIHKTYQHELNLNPSVKVAYLLRDGYLPYTACNQYLGNTFGHQIRVSRFSAFAASFRAVSDIDNYLSTRLVSQRYQEICKQLLLPQDKADAIIRKSLESNQPIAKFNELIHRQSNVDIIISESTKYRKRLYRYLEKSVGLKPGDTLMLVDLGYTGTTQIQLAPVFKDELNITVVGCYLISLKTPDRGSRRHGLLSTEHYDDRTLSMLVTYIAILEQICTSMDKSVIDFDGNGDPIYADTIIDSNQVEKIKLVQQQAVAFICDAKKFNLTMSDQAYRDLAGINLMRLLYMPTKVENDYFSTIKHDVNLGTDDVIPLLDIEVGLNNLKRRGWLHSLKEPSTQTRMNYPAEWRAIAIDLSIVLMAQHRHNFKLSPVDGSQRDIILPIVLCENSNSSAIDMPATPTYDGYYSLICPIPTNGHIAIHIGTIFKSIQLHCFEEIELTYLYSKTESYFTQDASDSITINGATLAHETILDILSVDSTLIFKLKNKAEQPAKVLRITFRPLIFRNGNVNISL